MRKINILYAILLALLLESCSGSWSTFHDGIYKGERYQLQSREVKGFSSNRIEYRFKLGNRKYIEVNALTTDWGPPYSEDIYCVESYELFEGVDGSFKNQPDLTPGERTFLYFSKRSFDEENYEAYASFIRTE